MVVNHILNASKCLTENFRVKIQTLCDSFKNVRFIQEHVAHLTIYLVYCSINQRHGGQLGWNDKKSEVLSYIPCGFYKHSF